MHNLDAVYENNYNAHRQVQSPDNMGIGLCFLMNQNLSKGDSFELLLETIVYADELGFSFACIIDENKHDHSGIKLNPTIIHSALSVRTSRIALRGECLPPDRRDAIRSVEDWSVVDNLSNGRIGIMMPSGSDQMPFGDLMEKHVSELRGLWKGDAVKRINGLGNEVELKIFPRPVQEELPIWVLLTEIHEELSFIKAGELGFHILTPSGKENNPLWLDRIEKYRKAVSSSLHLKEKGKVTLLADLYEDEMSVQNENEQSVAAVPENILSAFYEHIKIAGNDADEVAFRIDLAWGKEYIFSKLESLAICLKSMNVI